VFFLQLFEKTPFHATFSKLPKNSNFNPNEAVRQVFVPSSRMQSLDTGDCPQESAGVAGAERHIAACGFVCRFPFVLSSFAQQQKREHRLYGLQLLNLFYIFAEQAH